jgi:hypothetical protein
MPLREPRRHQMMSVVMIRVTGRHLVEEPRGLFLRAERAGQQQQTEPRGGIGGNPADGLTARVPRLLLRKLAAQRTDDRGTGEQGRRVRAVRFGEQPVTGPGGGAGSLGQNDDTVTPAVPVIAGGRQQGAGLGPAALGQLVSHDAQFGVVQGRIEELLGA